MSARPHTLRRPTTYAVTVLAVAGVVTLAACSGAGEASASTEARAGSSAARRHQHSPDQNRISGKKVDASRRPAARGDPQARHASRPPTPEPAAASPPLGFYADRRQDPDRRRDRPRHLCRRHARPEDRDAGDELGEPLRRPRQRPSSTSSCPTSRSPRSARRSTTSRPTGKDDLAFEATKGGTLEGQRAARTSRARPSPSAPAPTRRRSCVDWNEAERQGRTRAASTIKYFQKHTDYYLALQSRRIDAYLGPNPSVAYHVATGGQTEIDRQLLRRRRPAPGPDRRHHQEGQRPGRRRTPRPSTRPSRTAATPRSCSAGTSAPRPSRSRRSTRPACRRPTEPPPSPPGDEAPCTPTRSTRRPAAAPSSLAAAVLSTVGVLGACADPVSTGTTQVDPKALGDSKVLPVSFDTSADAKRVAGTPHPEIAATLPPDVKASGKLVIGSGGAGGGIPPLAFTADDNRTPIGVEVDVAHLVADVLGLEADVQTTSWENLFIGIDSGQVPGRDLQRRRLRGAQGEVRLRDVPPGPARLRGEEGLGPDRQGPRRHLGQEGGRRLGHAPGGDPAPLERGEREGRSGARRARLLPGHDRVLPRARLRPHRPLPRPEPDRDATTSSRPGRPQIVGTVSSSYPIPGKVGVLTKKGNGLAKPLSDAIERGDRRRQLRQGAPALGPQRRGGPDVRGQPGRAAQADRDEVRRLTWPPSSPSRRARPRRRAPTPSWGTSSGASRARGHEVSASSCSRPAGRGAARAADATDPHIAAVVEAIVAADARRRHDARLQGGLHRPSQDAARPAPAVRAARQDGPPGGDRRQPGPRARRRLRAAAGARLARGRARRPGLVRAVLGHHGVRRRRGRAASSESAARDLHQVTESFLTHLAPAPPRGRWRAADDDVVLRVSPDDDVAAPLLEDLVVEYGTRYGLSTPNTQLTEVPVSDFEGPHGAFIVLVRRRPDRSPAGPSAATTSRPRR